MIAAEVATIAGSLGFGSVLTVIVQAVIGNLKGKNEHEHRGWAVADKLARDKHAVTETLHDTRHAWHLENGKPYSEMPRLPDYIKHRYRYNGNGNGNGTP